MELNDFTAVSLFTAERDRRSAIERYIPPEKKIKAARIAGLLLSIDLIRAMK